jgi:hypothetical protein
MNKRIRLKRISENANVTFGVLIDDSTGIPICITLENPFLWNQINVSCIPKGVYECEPYSSKKYKNCYKVCDVPGRSAILFHTGNTVEDTEGCILPGTYFGEINNEFAVLDSQKALNKLKGLIGENKFSLIVE